MYYNDDLKIMFLSTPKTGSTAVTHALKKAYDFKWDRYGMDHRIRDITGFGRHTPLDHDLESEGWLVLTAVRNPYDLLVSWYYHHIERKTYTGVFNAVFVNQLISNGMSGRYFPKKHSLLSLHLDYATHILRWEDLEHQLNNVLSIRELDPVELQVVNPSRLREHKTYEEYYEDEIFRKFVATRFSYDFERFQYSF